MPYKYMPYKPRFGYFSCKGLHCEKQPHVLCKEEAVKYKKDLKECEPSSSNVPQVCIVIDGMESGPFEYGYLVFIEKNGKLFPHRLCVSCVKSNEEIPKEVPLKCNNCNSPLREDNMISSSRENPYDVQKNSDGYNVLVCRDYACYGIGKSAQWI